MSLLVPGGCVIVAQGTLTPANGAVNLTLSATGAIPNTGSNGTQRYEIPDFASTMTIMHYWGPPPSTCTIPAYSGPVDLTSNLAAPYAQSNSITPAAYNDSSAKIAATWSYRVGCNELPIVGNGTFHVQVWGQSHTIRLESGWKRPSISLQFPPSPGLVVFDGGYSTTDPLSKSVAAGTCPTPQPTNATTTPAPSKSPACTFKSSIAVVLCTISLLLGT